MKPCYFHFNMYSKDLVVLFHTNFMVNVCMQALDIQSKSVQHLRWKISMEGPAAKLKINRSMIKHPKKGITPWEEQTTKTGLILWNHATFISTCLKKRLSSSLSHQFYGQCVQASDSTWLRWNSADPIQLMLKRRKKWTTGREKEQAIKNKKNVPTKRMFWHRCLSERRK